MKATYQSVEEMLGALSPSYPVHCLRPRQFARAAEFFLNDFPGRVLFATKCNPNPDVLKILYKAGIEHFDTASLGEIALVSELLPEAKCYFHHPVKSRPAIASANSVYGVCNYTVDHDAELNKILDEAGNASEIGVQVRIATASGFATYDLSHKFGATVEEAVPLLRRIANEGLKPGVSFHVGSQCVYPEAYGKALQLVGNVVKAAGVDIASLNVGGGFPATYMGLKVPPMKEFFSAIRSGLAGIDRPPDCTVMCEPGRALVADGSSIVVQVHLRKDRDIYINDGIYGSLSEVQVGGVRPPARLVRLNQPVSGESEEFTVFGPTCDSLDVLPMTVRLPADLCDGDWIEFGQVGAYSNAVATGFNGFQTETFVAIEEPVETWAAA